MCGICRIVDYFLDTLDSVITSVPAQAACVEYYPVSNCLRDAGHVLPFRKMVYFTGSVFVVRMRRSNEDSLNHVG